MYERDEALRQGLINIKHINNNIEINPWVRFKVLCMIT